MRLFAWGAAIAGWGLLLPLLDVTPPPPTPLLAIFPAIVVYIVSSSLLVSAMVSRSRGSPLWEVFTANIAWEAVNNLAFATLGLVLALIYQQALPVGAIVLTVPLLLTGNILMLYTTREH